MQYSFVSAAVLALASVVSGQALFDAIQGPPQDAVLPAGVPYDLVWNPLDVKGTATIQLLQGKSNTTLDFGPVIAASIDNQAGKYTWTPEDLGFAKYGWRIILDADKTKFQDSNAFSIGAASDSTVTGSTAAPTSTQVITLSTGPSFTSSTATSTVPSSTATTSVSTSTSESTIAVPTTVASSTVSSSSNGTTSTQSFTTSRTPTGPSSTNSAAPTQSSNAAMANMVSGGFAVFGGAVLAFAL